MNNIVEISVSNVVHQQLMMLGGNPVEIQVQGYTSHKCCLVKLVAGDKF